MALKDSLKRKPNLLSVELPETRIEMKPLEREMQSLRASFQASFQASLQESIKAQQESTEALIGALAGELKQVRAAIAASQPAPQEPAPPPQILVSSPDVDVSGINQAIHDGLSNLSLEVPNRDFRMNINRDDDGRIASVDIEDV